MQPQLLYGADQSDRGKPRPSLAKHKSHRFDSTVWLVYLTCGLHEFPRRVAGRAICCRWIICLRCMYVCVLGRVRAYLYMCTVKPEVDVFPAMFHLLLLLLLLFLLVLHHHHHHHQDNVLLCSLDYSDHAGFEFIAFRLCLPLEWDHRHMPPCLVPCYFWIQQLSLNLELTDLGSKPQRSSCLFLPTTGIKDICHPQIFM